jgi:sulfate permease, SulP family
MSSDRENGKTGQSAVNDKAGARTRLALVFASLTLALCLLFLTDLLANLPKAVLAAVVLTAVLGLIDVPALFRMWRISKLVFYAAAIALGGVLLLGILQGILLAALASVLMLLARASQPHLAFLGRIPGTNGYSDVARHPENEPLNNLIAFRPETSLVYVNADLILESVLECVRGAGLSNIRWRIQPVNATLGLRGQRSIIG